MIRGPARVSAVVALAGAFTIWALHFLFLYGFQALACARGFADAQVGGVGIVQAAGALATAVAALACLWLLLAPPRVAEPPDDEASSFLIRLRMATAALALLAIGWNALPLALLPPCR